MASSLTHLEKFANVTSRDSVFQAHGATDGCAACQGDAQVHVPRCRKRFEDIFDRQNPPGQPRVVVQQEELGPVAEEAMSGDQHAHMEQEPDLQQHATSQEPSAFPQQPSSSSHEDPMQGNTTSRRARDPEDDDDTRTVRPSLEMSALISELCESGVPEIDWEKLGEGNSSVFDNLHWTGVG